MIELGGRFADGVDEVLERHSAPWSCVRLGARAEYRFVSTPPRNGGESAAGADERLDEWFHLYMLNRGLVMTPFHNMALVSPATTADDVDLHTRLFNDAVAEVLG
jgi:glutamate-1-semialdehyde 2,1-aminomutase